MPDRPPHEQIVMLAKVLGSLGGGREALDVFDLHLFDHCQEMVRVAFGHWKSAAVSVGSKGTEIDKVIGKSRRGCLSKFVR